MPIAVSVNTLREYRDSDRGFHAHCSRHFQCWHSGPVSIDALIQRFGWDFEVVPGRGRICSILYCSKCGQYHPDLLSVNVAPAKSIEHVQTHMPFTPVTIEESVRRDLERSRMARERDAALGLPEREWRGNYRKFGRR